MVASNQKKLMLFHLSYSEAAPESISPLLNSLLTALIFEQPAKVLITGKAQELANKLFSGHYLDQLVALQELGLDSIYFLSESPIAFNEAELTPITLDATKTRVLIHSANKIISL